VLHDRSRRQVHSAMRGIETSARLSFDAMERLIFECLDATEEKRLSAMSLNRATAPEAIRDAGFDIAAATIVLFVIDADLMGLLAMGPPLSTGPVPQGEQALLDTHLTTLMIHLKSARAFETIQALNDDLRQRNAALQQTIDDLTMARAKIDILEKARMRIHAVLHSELTRTRTAKALDFILIALLSMAVGLVFNFTNPNAVPLLPEASFEPRAPLIDAAQTNMLLNRGRAVLVDARPRELFSMKHIPQAINMPPALFDLLYLMKLSQLDPSVRIIVYGSTVSRRYDRAVIQRLKQRDHENIAFLAGDLAVWQAQGYAIEP
jgi:rhodanese-related sulfurtransferase